MKAAIIGFVDAETGAVVAALCNIGRDEAGDLLAMVMEAWEVPSDAKALEDCIYLEEALAMEVIQRNDSFFDLVEDFQYGQEH